MGKAIANEDLKVKFTNGGSPSDVSYSGDQGIDPVKIVPIKASKAKENSKFVCINSITLTFAVAGSPCPHTSVLYDFVSGAGSISATATKCKADSMFVLRKDDQGTCAGTWKLKAPPQTVVPCSCTLKISDAGQTNAVGL